MCCVNKASKSKHSQKHNRKTRSPNLQSLHSKYTQSQYRPVRILYNVNIMLFSTFIAAFGLAALGQSHMIMNTPKPFGNPDNSPLEATGTNFPCKMGDSGSYVRSSSTDMALGSDQPLSFTGSAVHGGGSCQISVTYDKSPNKQTVWKVIHSIQGGCPMRDISENNGNDASKVSPSQYSFKIPNDLPTGEAILAWTWFNKVGNREMYMNCAPITITGGSAKRSDDDLMSQNATQLVERDLASFNALPDMFVANIPSKDNCTVLETTNVKFPLPGNSVENNVPTTDLTPPECGKGAGGGAGSGSGPGSSPVPTSTASQVTAAPTQATGSAGASKPSLPGGVFITVPSQSEGSQPTATPAPAVPASSSAEVIAPSKATSAAPPAGTGTTGTGGALSGPCTNEGEWNCVGGSSFQQCGSGTWSVVQQMAAGTTCKSGQSTVLNVSAIKEKRAVRFSREHIRRHIRSS